MAYARSFNNQSRNANAALASSNSNDTSWKAQGFLNFTLPGVGKIGKISLKNSNPAQAAIIAAMTAGGERSEKLSAKLRISYNPVNVAPAYALEGVEAVEGFTFDAPDAEKASGYFNLDLIDDDGVSIRIGGVPLQEKVPMHKWLVAVLTKSEANMEAVLKQLTMDFQSATPRSLNLASLSA